MKLVLRDKEKIIDTEFGRWLSHHIKVKLTANISRYNFSKWDTYINTTESLPKLSSNEILVKEVLIFASNNIVCKGISGNITIQFNMEKFVPGFDRVKLHTILKAVNYGTLDIKACPIITETLKYFAKNINKYVQLYYIA